MMTRQLPLVRAERDHRTKGLLRLTMACNERCPFCNVPVEDYPRPTPAQHETERELEAFIASGAQTLTISGGEPTLLRRRLLAMVRRAREGGMPFVELQTNAIVIDAGYAEELRDAGLTSAFVSLLSDDAALHEHLAGLEGSFARTLSGIDALLDAQIMVTLNPVTAACTQERVARYVDFVAARLPRVRTISLSAVQPHGRAASDLSLLPDYAVLARSVREAQQRAEAHGIILLNPYCGLPLCVGWHDALERSVEAIEAHDDVGYGLDNSGNKRHGEPCVACALRTRCGGAWHAYWDHRDGSGIAAPLERREPLNGHAANQAQAVVVSDALDEDAWSQLAAATAPTVWIVTRRIDSVDVERLLRSGATDIALRATPTQLQASARALRRIARANALRSAQAKLRMVAFIEPDGGFKACYRAVCLAAATGMEAARIFARPKDAAQRGRWVRFVTAARAELTGFDVSQVGEDAREVSIAGRTSGEAPPR